MDLVLIADQSDPVVCKIMDYGKHIFEAKKQKNAQKKKQRRTQLKEMKFRPGTDQGDYQVKLRNLVRFLENGDKAKVTLRFRGVRWPTRNRHGAAQASGSRPGRAGRCRAVSENGRPADDHGDRPEKEGRASGP
jgi:translation initiation factor IF-3